MKINRVGKRIGVGIIGVISLLVVVTAILHFRKTTLNLAVPGGRALSPPADIPSFSLIDHQGRPFNNDSLKGNWTLAMIGFTYCPDVCPTTLSKMAAFFKKLDALPGSGKAPHFIFISADPFRDTPEVLGKYVNYFYNGFIGVTGTPVNINKLIHGLGLYYTYTDPGDDHFLNDVLHKPAMKDYGVVHSSTILFISPQGKLVAILEQPFEAEGVFALFTKLRNYYGD